MSPVIPRKTIDDILDRANIVETISAYIPLKQAGRNLKALCPFHQEKTPSFVVSPDKQIYHCFGCGAGGNSLSFLMQYEKMEFPEAVEALAKKVGVEIKKYLRRDDQAQAETKARLYEVNEVASFFYHKNLLRSVDCGPARDYLSRRGIPGRLIKDMRLGFAPNSWDSLLRYLREKRINPGLTSRLGLLAAKDRGGFYDRFRNRLIFPIFDVRSNVIAFGARVLDESLPKYINSPETPIYVKGRNLYGLNLSKESIIREDLCIVVEGYLDFILPYSLGIKNIVASLGTALTPWQIRLIKRYTNNVLMIYDSDAAGEMATLRSLDLLIGEGMSVKVVNLGQGLDPDLFARRFGASGLRKKIKEARSLFDYKLDFLLQRYDRRDIGQKAKVIEDMLRMINKFDSNLVRCEYIARLAQEFSLPEETLSLEGARIKREQSLSSGGGRNPAPNPALEQGRFPAFERLLVSLMLREQSLIAKIKDLVSGEEFRDQRLGQIARTVLSLERDGQKITPDKLGSYFPDPEMYSLVCRLSAAEEVITDKEKAIKECAFRLKQEAIRENKQRISRAIKESQKRQDEEKLNYLLEEFSRLSREERSIPGKVAG